MAKTFRQWERVTVQDDVTGRRITKILRITADTQHILMGVVVNKEDEEIAPKGVDEVKWMVSKDIIVKRVPLVMNNTYAMLEVKK